MACSTWILTVSCYFHGKPAYSEDPDKVEASKEQIRVNFRAVLEEPTQSDVAEKINEEEKTAEESNNDIVKLTLEEVEFYSSSIPNNEIESVTENKSIENGKNSKFVELTAAELELWATSEEKKKR